MCEILTPSHTRGGRQPAPHSREGYPMAHQMLLWGGFGTFVLVMLALDLGVFHRQARVVDVKEALRWSAMWIALALLFNLGIYLWYGTEAALAFLTGYVLEESLSVDNLFEDIAGEKCQGSLCAIPEIYAK